MWSKVPNIPISCISLELWPFTRTKDTVSIFKGLFSGRECAFKQIKCEEITALEIRLMCRELKISTMMVHQNIVRSYGFAISPPFVRALRVVACECVMHAWL